MSDETKQYEISVIFSREEAFEYIYHFIKENVDKVLNENPIRRVRLAYPIKKEETGYFVWMIVVASPDAIPTIQNRLETNPLVLRVLIITPPLPVKTERKTQNYNFKDMSTKDKTKAEQSESFKTKEDDEKSGGEILSNELLEKKLEEILE